MAKERHRAHSEAVPGCKTDRIISQKSMVFMKKIGYIEEERLAFIPKSLWLSHEFCFYLHDQLANLLIQYENNGVQDTVVKSIINFVSKNNLEFEELNIVNIIKKIGNNEPYKHHILSHVIMALASDMLHFLYESLKCFEKHKLSVAFSLLRKPLKEHLLFLSWVLADEDDFLNRFEKNNYKTLSDTNKEKQLYILKEAAKKVAIPEMFDYELIWNIIYSKNQKNGFEPTWQRATHLVTYMGKYQKTEDYNINFIFENTITDGYYHEFVYSKLPYILMFLTQITLECFNRLHPLHNKTIDHLILTTLGCYESLYLDGRKQSIARLFKKTLKDFIKCIHCGVDLQIKKKHAPLFFLAERLYCEHCNLITEFPLYWLMSQTNLTINRKIS